MASTVAAAGAGSRNDLGSRFTRKRKLWLRRLRGAAGAFVCVGLFSLASAKLGSPGPGYATQMIAALKLLYSREVQFAAACGNGAYAPSLVELYDLSLLDGLDQAFGGLKIDLQPVVSRDLKRVDCRGLPTTREFYATATGTRGNGPSFAVASDGVIWESATAVPPLPPFGPPAWPLK
jgi:hypothetical protein